MKTLISKSILLLFVLTGIKSFGQQESLSITQASLGVGFYTMYNDDYYFDDYYGTIESDYAPMIGASIHFYQSRIFEFGLSMGYQNTTRKELFETYDGMTGALITTEEDIEYNVIMFMPNFRFNWITAANNTLQIYSSASVGLARIEKDNKTNNTKDSNGPSLTGHATLAGMRFGNNFAFFMEFGVGSAGLLNMGLSYRPKTK